MPLLVLFLVLDGEGAGVGGTRKEKVNTSKERSCVQVQFHFVLVRHSQARQGTQFPLLYE